MHTLLFVVSSPVKKTVDKETVLVMKASVET